MTAADAMTRGTIVYTTCPDEATARELARVLIAERWAACANLYPIVSVYRWQDEVAEDREWALWLKTRADLYPALEREIGRRHPYDVPAIVALPLTEIAPPYAAWLEESTRRAADGHPDQER